MKLNNRVNINTLKILLMQLFVLSVTAQAQRPAVFDINGNDDRLHSKASIQRQAAAYHASKGAEAADTAEARRPSAVDFDILNDILLGDSDTLELELPDGTILVGEVADKIVRSRSTYTLTGYIQGDIPGEFLASVNGKVLAALVILSDGRSYDVRYNPGGYHVLRNVDTSVPLSCGAVPAPEDTVTADTSSVGATQGADDGTYDDVLNVSTQAAMAADDGTYIDVLNLYTPAARVEAGGSEAVEALAYLFVDYANLAFANSQVTTRLRIVHIEEIFYYEASDMLIDLGRLQNNSDGYMDEAHALRETYGADLVHLLNMGNGWAGIAYILTDLGGSSVYGITKMTAGAPTWAHEIGHNLGCHHAVGDGSPSTPQGGGLFNYSHGWRFDTTDGLKATIMAYNPGARIPHFSNPDVTYLGVATGQPLGLSDEAHNALTINNSAPVVSGWRTSVVGDNSAPIFVYETTEKAAALSDAPYADSLANDAYDQEDGYNLTFSKVSGPAWLTVASNGDLNGTPSVTDVGINVFTVRATDSLGLSADAEILLVVVGDLLDIVLITSGNSFYDDKYKAILHDTFGAAITVEALPNEYAALDATKIARLEAADLIMSGTFLGPDFGLYMDDAAEITQWNSISTPLVLNQAYLPRVEGVGSGWGWTPHSSHSFDQFLDLDVELASDPVFDGVTIASGVANYRFDDSISFIVIDPMSTLGTVIATPKGQSSDAAYIRWTGSETNFYNNSPESPGGPRLFTSASASDPYSSLSDNGKLMLRNAYQSVVTTNQAPSFSADVITAANATQDTAYSASIVGQVTDPEGDSLAFLKTDGPEWLVVNTDGTLSGTPTESDTGENRTFVRVIDAAGNADEALVIVYVDAPVASYYDFATSDIAIDGTIVNDYTATHAKDGIFEELTETTTGGSPSSKYSFLAHAWHFNVSGGDKVTFVVEAHRPDNTELDDFLFRYSTAGPDTALSNMITISTDIDDDLTLVTFELPVSTSGDVWVRVQDTNASAGNALHDTLYIEKMYIRSDVIDATPNQAPSFTSDPIVKPEATQDQLWSDSLAGDATDPDTGDTLTFSKVSGPTWLTVASDGSLSGTPGIVNIGLNQFTVKVQDQGLLSDTAVLEITVVASSGGTTYIDLADSDIPVSGTISGTYIDTHSEDGIEQQLTEVLTGGNPSTRISYLEHKWTFNVTGGDTVTFNVTARRDPVDFEFFHFAYSTDDVNYTVLITPLQATSPTTYTYELPSSLSGPVYIRVEDTHRGAGQTLLSALFVDHMYIESVSSGGGDTTPPNPDPMTWFSAPTATSSSSISMIATTATDASGVEFYFANLTDPAHDSGWQSSTSYLDIGLTANTSYTYTVKARDLSTNQNETAVSTSASATTQSGGGPVDYTATSDIAVSGTVSGDYTNTQLSDNVYESITEVESGGKPSNRYSYLEHKWTVSVGSGTTATFFVEAYRTANTEGDDFVFAYSTDDVNYTNMVTVTKTSDDDVAQSYVLPGGTSGTVYIRVLDTDQSAGNKGLDTIYVDDLYIRTE